MTSLEQLIRDALADDDEWLYPVYRSVRQRSGPGISLGAFLDAVQRLMRSDEVRLVHADSTTRDSTELREMPADLGDRYMNASGLDSPHDPLDMWLALGPKGRRPVKAWTLTFNPDDSTFVLTIRTTTEDAALKHIGRADRSLRLSVESRTTSPDGIVITGSYLREGE